MTVPTIKNWSPIRLRFPLSSSWSHFWVMISFTNKSFRTYHWVLSYATEFNLTIIAIKSNFIRIYTLNYRQLLFYLMLDTCHCAASNKTVHCELYCSVFAWRYRSIPFDKSVELMKCGYVRLYLFSKWKHCQQNQHFCWKAKCVSIFVCLFCLYGNCLTD